MPKIFIFCIYKLLSRLEFFIMEINLKSSIWVSFYSQMKLFCAEITNAWIFPPTAISQIVDERQNLNKNLFMNK